MIGRSMRECWPGWTFAEGQQGLAWALLLSIVMEYIPVVQ